MKILLVEDEENVADFIRRGLEEEEFIVDVSYDGKDGFLKATTDEYDLIILDVMLPGVDGVDLCKLIRMKEIITPILMLTAKDTIEDKVRGLDSGADDYLTKPFAFDELLARIRALIRRKSLSVEPLKCADLKLDPLKRKVSRAGKDIYLRPKEFGLLEFLMRNKNKVVSRSEILKNVWGYDFDPATNVVDVHINFLRDKIDRDYDKKLIKTVRGSGYMIREDD
ncbi:MAG: DNA-binding response regulator [Nitrospirae bacterium]|nr:MAG: DNA-binding response regulator [Nitrospirota bacterium]